LGVLWGLHLRGAIPERLQVRASIRELQLDPNCRVRQDTEVSVRQSYEQHPSLKPRPRFHCTRHPSDCDMESSAELEEKGSIFGLLSIGLIACIASVMTLVSQYILEKDPLWNYTTLLAWIMVELVVSLVAACAPTLAYLLPRSMYSKHYASNSASRLQSHKVDTGFRSRPSRNDFALRARFIDGEIGDSEDEELRIIVQDDIKMKWQSKGRRVARGT
jgi:hypothetical protein